MASLQFVLGQRRQDEEGHRMGRRLTTKTVNCRSHKQQVVAHSGSFCHLIVQGNASTVLHKYALITSNFTQYKNSF